jgi:(1->4)-alpha-D-glucan 1-alpha-D-glucosylmutase
VQYVRTAIASAQGSTPIGRPLAELVESLLLSRSVATNEEAEFVARFQQLTGPVMAKGVEDMALYCYDRLLALNEVGCDPSRFGISPDVFHSWNTAAHLHWPRGMLTTSTHDTKRSEDVRARLSVISEMAEEWADQVRAWSAQNHHAWGGRTPDRNAEYLLYQTLAGAWPISLERVQAYMMKACREAGRHTTWESPDDGYELRISRFVETVVLDGDFIRMLEEFVPEMVAAGRVNSLAQTLLKLTAPGIPDIYQGCEIWDNSLVDPDNRRGVDFSLRRSLLEELETGQLSCREIMDRMDEGLPKLHVIREALAVRKRHPEAFSDGHGGCYCPLLVTGPKLANVIAFRRGEHVAVIVPRLTAKLGAAWGDTEVDFGGGRFVNLLDGSVHEGKSRACVLFENFPIAILETS